MAKFQLKDAAEGKILFAKGSLTIEHACALKEILIQALKTTDHLLIDLGEITSFDLACLQILCSAHKSFNEAHKHMDLQDTPPEIFVKILYDSGIDRSAFAMSI